MSEKKQPKAISLFAGAGGCSLGFKQAGYDIIYATDSDKDAIKTYQHNFPETRSECRDINEIDFEDLLLQLNLKPGEIDILIGGPPCQGFSTAGPRFWDDPRNHLLKQYIRALEIIQPKWFLMENVEGLLTSNNGEYVEQSVKAFIELGYTIRLEKVYSHEFGVPQRRKRVIIIGNHQGTLFTFPKPVSQSHGKIFSKSEITLEHALKGLPKPASKNVPVEYNGEITDPWTRQLASTSNFTTEHFTQKTEGIQLERISHLLPGQTMKDLPEHLQHDSFKKRSMRRVLDGTPTEKRGGAPSGLKRMKLDEPCLTITGAAIREFVHPLENRCLTIRECARIQTFPDDFEFIGSTGNKIQQIGNAIPPLLAKTFANHLLKFGFEKASKKKNGILLDFVLTKSDGYSPALKKTEKLLSQLMVPDTHQLALFENVY